MSVLAVTVDATAAAATEDAVLVDELVALEKSKLDPWYGEASTAVYLEGVAEDSTYFDPWIPKKLKGAEVREYLAAFEGNIPNLEYEIVDATADRRGDIVIFTYDITHPADPVTGEVVPRWMVTKILNRVGDGWEVIHTHYGLPVPFEG